MPRPPILSHMNSDAWFEDITNAKDFLIALLIFLFFCLLPALYSHLKGYGFSIGFFGALIMNPVHMLFKLVDQPSLKTSGRSLLTDLAYKAGSLFVRLVRKILKLFGVSFINPANNSYATTVSSFPLNQEHLRWAYDYLLRSRENEIKSAFPNGKAQMGEIIIEILGFCEHDPDKCTWQIYMRAAMVYLEIIENYDNQQQAAIMLEETYRDIVLNQETAAQLIEHLKTCSS